MFRPMYAGCTAESSEDIVTFLRAQPPERLILPTRLVPVLNLHPIKDDRCLTASTDELYASGNFAPVSLGWVLFF